MNSERNRIAQGWTALSLAGAFILLPLTSGHAQTQSEETGQLPTGPAPTRTPKNSQGTLAEVAQNRAAKFGKEVGLTSEQITQLAQLNSVALIEMQTLFNTRPKDKDDARRQLLIVLEKRQKAIDALLTPEQIEKYSAVAFKDIAALLSELITRKLKLTDKQFTRLNRTNQEILVKLQAAARTTDKAKRAEAISQVKRYKDREYQAILTPAQYSSLKQMRQYMTPTNADTRLDQSQIRHNPSTGPVVSNPYAVYQISPAIPVGFGGYAGYGGVYGSSVVYPSFWAW